MSRAAPEAPAAAHDGGDGAWRPRDCHAHTTFSDGALAPTALVALARMRGVLPSVTDHLTRDIPAAVGSVASASAYLDVLERLAERVPELARGAECCWHDALWRELPDAVWSRFTHVVGSLHAVTLPDGGWLPMFRRGWPDGLTADAYMDAHVATLERFAAEMPVDVLAHPTLLPLALRERPLEELWTEAREARAARALARAGIAFEISNRYRPHERFVRQAVSAGARISLGSDGHTEAQVGMLEWPLSVARAAGVPDAELYDPFVHGRRERHPAARR
jgi:histidinol phosphatase-like PHP family hydrolase